MQERRIQQEKEDQLKYELFMHIFKKDQQPADDSGLESPLSGMHSHRSFV